MTDQELLTRFVEWMLDNKWYVCQWDHEDRQYVKDNPEPKELAQIFINEWNTGKEVLP